MAICGISSSQPIHDTFKVEGLMFKVFQMQKSLSRIGDLNLSTLNFKPETIPGKELADGRKSEDRSRKIIADH
jgi:hypothetical protein